ncbi:MAG: tRNA uridine-5-carboxymethylaminomethyl(34) synthesis GTPase MnmE [Clostridiales bacterium]|nr:tRNA uridine-5-carboxymethylaminomethyl(34) synthesis GTPase MnmE [Clostridiales bacterium]
MEQRTIAALATPQGTAGIHVIRISGDDAHNVIKQCFSSPNKSDINFEHGYMQYGYIKAPNGEILDEGYAVCFKAPRSYTGEDVCEIQCHGSLFNASRILDMLYSMGVRPAEPGEFTKRAFLNGRIDLVKAESVMDIISSDSTAAVKNSMEHLSGTLSRKNDEVKDSIVYALANINADIDFPDEDTEYADRREIIGAIDNAYGIITELCKTASTGRMIKDGVRVAICGAPNVGKSTLLNCLTQSDRAIVTDIPGTTRDILEECIYVNGIKVRLFDTAGIRDTEDSIEQIGIERTVKLLENADLALIILDGTRELSKSDMELLSKTENINRIVAVNKSDEGVLYVPQCEHLVISAATSQGINALKDAIYEKCLGSSSAGEGVYVTNARHIALYNDCIKGLERAKEDLLDSSLPVDLAATWLNDAYIAIKELTGEEIDNEIIDRIFAQFCLGK